MTPATWIRGVAAIAVVSALAAHSFASEEFVREPAAIRLASPEPPSRVSVDIAEMGDFLADLAPDARPDQIADWAVLGTLVEAVDEEAEEASLRLSPMRLPELVEAFDFQYGEGRFAVLSRDRVWLFHSAADPHPHATLGRLADRVQMEIGGRPRRIDVFSYAPDLDDGKVVVQHTEQVALSAIYGAEYGMVSATVSNATQLAAFLERVDDVVLARPSERGVELHGRRFDDHRTPGLTIDDVAALYQAHRTLERAAEQDPIHLYNVAIDTFNDGVRRGLYDYDDRVATDALSSARALLSRLHELDLARGTRSLSGLDEVSSFLEGAHEDVLVARRRGESTPAEPGFSLDPSWDHAGMAAGIRRLVASPRSVLQAALRTERAPDVTESTLTPRLAARDTLMFGLQLGARLNHRPWTPSNPLAGFDALHVAPSHETRNELLRIADLLESEPARGEIALEALTSSSDRRLGFWVGLGLEFLRGEHETQCARYDGPLDGTRVGMVLFYTDVMAKIWAATDYAGSAPAEFVPGFRSGPRLGRYIPSEYEEESRALPSTRIWFGLRDDRLARDADEHTLSFAPIVTRVYTAGSNPLVPGAESTADESSRQVYGWWDRHYASVADHEPQFHLQNQIMKWSVITAALAERDVVRSLGQVPVDHTQRFDRYVNDTDGLRYQGPFRLLPDRPSARGTECMERLQSYGFDAFGGEHRYNITGGVSLVGRRSLGELRAAPWAARGASRAGRASLDVSPGRVLTQAPEAARFRRGAVQFAGGDVQMARVPGGLELHVGERQLHVAATRGPQGAVLSPAVRLPGADSARTSSILQRLRAGDDIVQATAVAGPNQRLISGSGSSRRSLADALAARPGQLGGSADDALEVALARVRRGDDIPGGSLSALPAPDPLPVTGGMRTQPASVRALGEAAALRGQFGEAATVVVGGRRARTVLRAEAVQPVPNRSRAFEQILSGDADVYVQESRALQSFDWDMDPRGSVARLVGDPRYVLERVPLAETAIFRPHMLADDASRYTLRQTAPYGAHLAPTRAGAARPVFRLRLCTDSTGDGRDDEAGSQCAAP